MKFILEREQEIRGQHTGQNAQLVDDYMSKVLPRYLGPLETDGRSIQPCLCHTDLWPGNVKLRADASAIVFDANALWAHSEGNAGFFFQYDAFANKNDAYQWNWESLETRHPGWEMPTLKRT